MDTITKKARDLMVKIAKDPSYGYSQPGRGGSLEKKPSDFDCSSLVSYCYQKAGVPFSVPYTSLYTGNMYNYYLRAGFVDVTLHVNRKTGTGLVPGDVLLHPYDGKYGHTEMYIGNGQMAGARRDENGRDGYEGAKPGDQTGREIEISAYADFTAGWTYVLRYEADMKQVFFAPVFDPTFYDGKYEDLHKAFNGNAKNLYQHFCEYGMKEGRQASADFDPKVYRDRYADLKRAFGQDWQKYYTHYIEYGISEGRSGKPEEAPAPVPAEDKYVATTDVYVRSGPGGEYGAVRVLKKGEQVTASDKQDVVTTWYKVTDGWVSGAYLKKS